MRIQSSRRPARSNLPSCKKNRQRRIPSRWGGVGGVRPDAPAPQRLDRWAGVL